MASATVIGIGTATAMEMRIVMVTTTVDCIAVGTNIIAITTMNGTGIMAYVIAEPCIGVKDTACVDACPVDCIHPKKNTTYDDGRPTFDEVSQLYIDPVECIDCGACVPVCPVSAIFALDDLPEKWKHYTEINESYVKGGKFTPEEFAKHAAK